MVHSDFHYAKAVLFSAHRLWYYIPLSLYHFQRLPFLLIQLNRMLKTSRACFWACLTLLLWSHIHSHTHLFGFSNLAICCGCPALSIWVFVVIYACHLSNASNQWVIFPLRLTFAASLTLPTGEQAPLPPPFPPPQGCTVMPHSSGCVDLTPLYDFTRPGGFSFLHHVSRDPSSGWCVYAQPLGHDALPSMSSSNTDATLPCQTPPQTACSSTLHPAHFPLFSAPKVSGEDAGLSPEGTCGCVLLGTAGSWGVSNWGSRVWFSYWGHHTDFPSLVCTQASSFDQIVLIKQALSKLVFSRLHFNDIDSGFMFLW